MTEMFVIQIKSSTRVINFYTVTTIEFIVTLEYSDGNSIQSGDYVSFIFLFIL